MISVLLDIISIFLMNILIKNSNINLMMLKENLNSSIGITKFVQEDSMNQKKQMLRKLSKNYFTLKVRNLWLK